MKVTIGNFYKDGMGYIVFVRSKVKGGLNCVVNDRQQGNVCYASKYVFDKGHYVKEDVINTEVEAIYRLVEHIPIESVPYELQCLKYTQQQKVA